MRQSRQRFLDRRIFYKGDVIFAEGAKGDAVFLIESGEVRLAKNAGTPTEIEIGTVGQGAIFGEMALIDGSPRMASAVAQEETVVIAIGTEEFEEKLKRVEPKTRRLFELMIDYCRQTLPFAERRKDPKLAEETNHDQLMRKTLDAPEIKSVNHLEDRFLSAMFEILIGYARRRLPSQ